MPHTPGPWHEGQGNGEGHIFAGEGQRMRIESRGSTLYPVATIVGGWEPGEDVANGKLITAAPDAHDILTELARWYAEGGATPFKEAMFDENRTWKQAVAEYLAKAEGR